MEENPSCALSLIVPYFSILNRIIPHQYLISAFSMEENPSRILIFAF